MKKTLLAVTLAVGLTAGGAVAAQQAQDGQTGRQNKSHRQGGKMGKGQHSGALMGRIAQELNLTDAQKQYARQLMADTRQQAEPIMTQMRQNRQDLQAAIKQNNQTAIAQLNERQGALRAQVATLHSNAMASFYQQLTPEQRTKAEELQAQWKQRMEERRSRGQQFRNR